MPYTGPQDESLPANVKSLPEQSRRKWVAIFNRTYQNAKSGQVGGGPATDQEAERIAFRIANGTVKASEEQTFIPMQTFLVKLRELLSPHVAENLLADAIKQARSHAGGKARSYNRLRATGEDNELSDEELDSEIMSILDDAEPITAVNSDGLMFREADGRVFVELSSQFQEPPERMPFMPIPGKYTHPKWGEIELSKERLDKFVQNFNQKVYQERLPVDAEHEYKLSGAVGWITGLVQNDDGSVDANVEWTDRGRALIEADSYKYVSPEWWDKWVQPESGTEYEDVAIGAALTTRPFFKEKVLRPLAGKEFQEGVYKTEDGQRFPAAAFAYVPDPESPSTWKLRLWASPGGGPDPRIVGAAIAALGPGGFRGQRVEIPAADRAAVVTKVRAAWRKVHPDVDPSEMPAPIRGNEDNMPDDNKLDNSNTHTVTNDSKKMTELEAQLAEAKKATETAQEESKKMAERVATLELDARTKRFTDEVMGRSDANGTRWAGDSAKHINILLKMCEALGEDSEPVKDYIEQQRAIAAQMEKNPLLKPVGSGNDGGGDDAWSQIEAKATEILNSGQAKSFAEAVTKVTDNPANRDLILRYERER